MPTPKPKPKPKQTPFKKVVFAPQPGEFDMPVDGPPRVDRANPLKASAYLRKPGAQISAAAATQDANRVFNAPKQPSKGNNVFSKFGDIVPYMSNIANSFRRAPLPSVPGQVSSITPSRVNGDAQLYEADRTIRGANAAADRNLDENTAAAVKGSNLAQGFRMRNGVHEWVNNSNAEINNRTAMVNANIEGQNVGMMNQYREDLVGAKIANQREQSANISNAADKYVGQQQFRDAQDLDMAKLQAMKPLWARSGVFDRTYPGYAGGGELPGFKDLSGTASAGAGMGSTMNAADNLTNYGYSWGRTNTAGWEDYPVKDPEIGLTGWRKKAFPDKTEFMKNGTQFQYMIKNMPHSNAYQHQFQHHSTAPVIPGKMSDKTVFAAYGGKMRRRIA